MEEPDSTAEPSHYLIAFKDHTIYSAVAYWVDGDTLHYFTSANTHNQVSLSLIDRDLTERLNKESGLDVKLPPPTPIR
jgi:endonuclease YncB( thermonuclease family)